MLARGQASCSQRSSSPPQPGSLQSHLHIHVLTAIVCDNDVEMWVASDLGQALHISDELLHPASLVLHYAGRSSRENGRVRERQTSFHSAPSQESHLPRPGDNATIGIVSMRQKDLRASAWAFYSSLNTYLPGKLGDSLGWASRQQPCPVLTDLLSTHLTHTFDSCSSFLHCLTFSFLIVKATLELEVWLCALLSKC